MFERLKPFFVRTMKDRNKCCYIYLLRLMSFELSTTCEMLFMSLIVPTIVRFVILLLQIMLLQILLLPIILLQILLLQILLVQILLPFELII